MDRDLLDRTFGDCTYRNYKHNRLASSETTPETWRTLYGAERVTAFEARFEQEMTHELQRFRPREGCD